MKLVFFSGGHEPENNALDKAMLALCPHPPKITFIPASSYFSDEDFSDFVKHYEHYGVTNFIHFPVDTDSTPILKHEVFSSDIIHLSGGNTFYFLKHLRRQNLFPELKQFVARGGILTGLSAGAIIMTKDITTASFPDFDCDKNYENLRNFKALNLVDFDFFPHYKNSKRYHDEMKKYSIKSNRPLYACHDGGGIIVNNNELHFYGMIHCFYQGTHLKINGIKIKRDKK